MLDDKARAEYLERIALTSPVAADEPGLRELHRAHLLTVPFENLSIHLGEPISLGEDDLIAKVVTRLRGGFCYELNGAFALLLEALSATVRRVSARVYGATGFGPPFDHLALIVSAADGSGPWLIDVGFGDNSVYPLRLDDRGEQPDPGGTFRLTDTEDGDILVTKDGEPQYVIERRVRTLADFVPTCWWQQTSPESHFRASTICSLVTPDGKISVSGHTLIRTSAGMRSEEVLPDDAALLAAYRDHLGMVLTTVPARISPKVAAGQYVDERDQRDNAEDSPGKLDAR